MADGTRVIVRTLNGPAGKDGEVTLARLATELEPYAEDTDLAALAGETQNVHGIPDTSQLVKYTDLGALWNRGEFGQFGLVLAETTDPAHARAELGITVDTTVGTRVFIAGQMIHGDTGWRAFVVPESAIVSGGVIELRREGNLVTAYLDVLLKAGTGRGPLWTGVPFGFRPRFTDRVISGVGLENNATLGQMVSVYSETLYWCFQMGVPSNTEARPTAALRGSLAWQTVNHWPTTLPGTPA